MVSPYSVQSPEDIAKEYGGNKQKIMAAAQAGVVDPTAAVIAGMFIDRMRAAAQQEMAGTPTTVAQDTFAPPAPPAGGLGAIAPQGAPQMQPPMAAPAMPAPEGGIGQLDFAPAQMAAGGIVGYAEGDEVENLIQEILYRESRGRDFAEDGTPLTSPKGARYAMQVMPDTARDPGFGVAPAKDDSPEEYNRVGRDYARAMYNRYGGDERAVMVAYNAGPGVADKWIESGKNMDVLPEETRKYIAGVGQDTPERDIYTAEGRAGSLADLLSVTNQYYGALPSAQRERLMAEVEKELDPEAQKQRKEEDLYMRLAEFGFQLAASTAPSILSSISEAAAATFPGVKADAETRKEAKEKALSKLMAFENMDRETATDALNLAVELYKSNTSVEQAKRELALAQERQRIEAEQFKQTLALQQAELAVARMKARGGLTTEDAVKEAKERLAAYESGTADPEVAALAEKYGDDGRANLLADLTRSIQAEYAAIMGVPAAGFGAPPEGAVRKVK